MRCQRSVFQYGQSRLRYVCRNWINTSSGNFCHSTHCYHDKAHQTDDGGSRSEISATGAPGSEMISSLTSFQIKDPFFPTFGASDYKSESIRDRTPSQKHSEDTVQSTSNNYPPVPPTKVSEHKYERVRLGKQLSQAKSKEINSGTEEPESLDFGGQRNLSMSVQHVDAQLHDEELDFEEELLDPTDESSAVSDVRKKPWHRFKLRSKAIRDKHRREFENQDPTTEIYPYNTSEKTILFMVQTLRTLRENGLPDQIAAQEAPRHSEAASYLDFRRALHNRTISRRLQDDMRKLKSNPKYQQFLRQRKLLPIHRREYVDKLIELVHTNHVVILVSQTGSGKTTQLPQIILDWRISGGSGSSCNIICTQPRRLAAISVARRVAEERQDFLGGHVGFAVRFAKKSPRHMGSIRYWTAGILLKELYEVPHIVMERYSHLIIDEVHERDITTDLVLTALRDLIRERHRLGKQFPKIILMSATIDALDFQRYFEEPLHGNSLKACSLEVPGRNFGVQVHTLDDFLPDFMLHASDSRFMTLMQANKAYLQSEDEFSHFWSVSNTTADGDLTKLQTQPMQQYSPKATEADDIPIELVTATVAHAFKCFEHGDILVFLPGIAEIDKVSNALQAHPILGIDFNDTDQVRVYKLHASLYETNEQVFDAIPEGCRRVVLSTNIAQTSITLPDVVHVIDAGRQRRVMYNPDNHVNEFRCHWIDKSTSAQRRGRSGRTQPGHYWTLFTQARYDSFDVRPLPEIKVADLTASCLAVKAKVGNHEPLRAMLARAMDPPDPSMVDPAVLELKKLRMLDDNEDITPLGRFAAWLPLPPATARSLLLGVLFRCLEPLLIMASHNSDKPLIHNPKSLNLQVESLVAFANGKDDDRAAFISAFRSYDAAHNNNSPDLRAELQEHDVKETAYREILNVAGQLCSMMVKYNLLKLEPPQGSVFTQLPAYMNENASSTEFVKSLALAMQHSNLGVYSLRGRSYYVGSTPVLMKPFSINASKSQKLGDEPNIRSNGQLISYSLLMQIPGTALPYMTETANVTPLMAMLFGGPIEVINGNIIQIDGWLKYRISTKNNDGVSTIDDGTAVGIILEFRRTLDRFLQLACATLQRTNVWSKPLPDEDGSPLQSLLAPGNQLTDTLTRGLRHVMETDALQWHDYLLRNSNQEAQDVKSR